MAGRRIVVEFAGDTSKLDTAFAKVKSSSSGLETAVKGVAAGAAFGLVTAQIGDAIQAASSLNESMSKSNNVFGASAAAIDAWAQQGADDFGLSKQAALEAASSFGNMFNQLGIGATQSAQLSQNIVELATDFASFHHADISQVVDAQSAAFRGEYDSLQRFLPLINAAAVEQEAMAMTGKKNKDSLTAQEKALAVNNLMMKGAGAAAGDFDRTSDSLANQQLKLAGNLENTQAIIGQKLQPVMNDVLHWLNSDGIPGFIKFSEVIGEGFADAAGFFVGGMADIASAVGQTLEKVDQFIPGMEGIPEQIMRGVDEMRDMEAGLHNVKINLDFATGAAADQAAAQAAAAKAMDKMTTSTKDATKATADYRDAQLDARSASLSLEQSQHSLAKAQDAYNEFLETGGIDMDKVKEAQRKLTEAQLDAAKAASDVADAQKALNDTLKPASDRDRQKLARDEASALDDVTEANMNLKDAQTEQLRVTNDSTLSADERTRVWLRVNDAARAVKDAEDALTEAHQRSTDFQKEGTTQSQAYKDALLVLQEKQRALTEATEAQKSAQINLNVVQSLGKDHAEQLWKVTNDLKEAQLDLDQKTLGVEKSQSAVKTAFDATKSSVRDVWANVVGLKDDLASGWVVDPTLNALAAGPVLPGQTRAVPTGGGGAGVARTFIPRAGGGPVDAGLGYIVGESGPELFFPGRSGSISPNGAGGAVTVIFNNSGVVGDPAAVARQIQALLLQEQRRTGTLGFR